LKQKEIEVAAFYRRFFLVGLAFNFKAIFHELEEITQRALLATNSKSP
jgi:hypothetical protein